MTGADAYLDLPYHIELVHDATPGETGGWAARVKELPGCIAQGGTVDELMLNLRTAMEAWIDDALTCGEEIPLPLDEIGKGELVARIPAALHETLAGEARRQGVSTEHLVTALLAGGLGWQLTARVESETAAAG